MGFFFHCEGGASDNMACFEFGSSACYVKGVNYSFAYQQGHP